MEWVIPKDFSTQLWDFMVWYLKSPHRLVRAFCCNFGDYQSRSGHRNAVPALRNSHRSLLLSYIFLLFCRDAKPPLRKGRWLPVGQTEGLSLSTHYNPPVSSADSPLYTRGPFPVPTIILQITMLLFVKGEDLYCAFSVTAILLYRHMPQGTVPGRPR